MWFKNLTIYRFTKQVDWNAETFEQQLADNAFQACRANDLLQLGWSSPLGKSSPQHLHVAGSYWMVCLQKQEKILPASVVNEQVAEKAEEIELSQHRKVSRKEKAELKDQTIIELMPKAFVKTQRHFAYINTSKGYMVVNTGSAKVADELTSSLRKAVGSLPIRPIAVMHSPQDMMTQWLSEQAELPSDFSLGYECEISSTGEDKGSIKYKGMDLDIDQINQHLSSGMVASQLSLAWKENMQFSINADLTIKRLKFLDLVQEKYSDIETDDAASKFDASFTIMSAEVDELLDQLLLAFGGEDRSAILENAE